MLHKALCMYKTAQLTKHKSPRLAPAEYQVKRDNSPSYTHRMRKSEKNHGKQNRRNPDEIITSHLDTPNHHPSRRSPPTTFSLPSYTLTRPPAHHLGMPLATARGYTQNIKPYTKIRGLEVTEMK
ncbi:hypothetical protein VTH06DRAFT_2934 [Thermothelomyces fergusii]